MQNDNPYIEYKPAITPEGKRKLSQIVSDTESDVYAISDGISPVMAAAAMARLSRSPNDMRLVMLTEFVDKEGKDAELLHRVISQYGDDSVQQLVGVQLVVENASNLLTKQLEWGRLAAYLEQSTRYIYFDQKNAKGQYKYYRPQLPAELLGDYCTAMDALFDSYSELVRGVTGYVRKLHPQGDSPKGAWQAATRAQACDAVRSILPTATTATVGIFGSAQAVDNMIMNLMSQPLPEAVLVANQLLVAARTVVPEFMERTDVPERGGATVAYRGTTRADVRELAKEIVEPAPAKEEESVRLLDVWPARERDVAAGLLFEASDVPYKELQRQAEHWDSATIERIFRTYFGERLNRRHRPGRALEEVHYVWEITADYGTFRDLQRHRMVDAWEWQRLTPNYGYEVPELVREAGYEEPFRDCFTRAEALYDRLARAGHEVEAQYATLLGHRMRYRFITNAREAFHMIELRTTPQGHPGYRKICRQMYEEIKRVHPLIASGMKFVGLDEDPALTRLAAEKAAAFKLEQLEKTKAEDLTRPKL